MVALSFWLGVLQLRFLRAVPDLRIFFGVFLSVAAVLLEEISFRRYPGWSTRTTRTYGVLENLGYRQTLALFKVKRSWISCAAAPDLGRMEREGVPGCRREARRLTGRPSRPGSS